MLSEQTIETMKELRLWGMLEALEEQYRTVKSEELSFDERLGLLVDTEINFRENRRLERLVKAARFKYSNACIENINYSAKRKLDKSAVLQLANCRWIKEHHNIIVSGSTGTGKSWFSCAIGVQACRKGFKTIYRRAPRLYDELSLAHADGTYSKLLAQFARADLLIIDDFGSSPIKAAERKDLFEIIEDRDSARSTIVAGQLPYTKWFEYLGDPTTADAICDRLIHNSYKFDLKGPSIRKELAEKAKRK